MPGPLGNILGRILGAAGNRAAATDAGGAAGKVLTGVGTANARAYSAMLAGEIVSRTRRSRKPEEEEEKPIPKRSYFEEFLASQSPNLASSRFTLPKGLLARRVPQLTPDDLLPQGKSAGGAAGIFATTLSIRSPTPISW